MDLTIDKVPKEDLRPPPGFNGKFNDEVDLGARPTNKDKFAATLMNALDLQKRVFGAEQFHVTIKGVQYKFTADITHWIAYILDGLEESFKLQILHTSLQFLYEISRPEREDDMCLTAMLTYVHDSRLVRDVERPKIPGQVWKYNLRASWNLLMAEGRYRWREYRKEIGFDEHQNIQKVDEGNGGTDKGDDGHPPASPEKTVTADVDNTAHQGDMSLADVVSEKTSTIASISVESQKALDATELAKYVGDYATEKCTPREAFFRKVRCFYIQI